MLLLFNHQLASLILLFDQEIDALQSLGLELVDQVIKGLQACDGDHAAVIWRIGDLHSKAEDSDQENREVWATDEGVVAWRVRGPGSDLLQHSVHRLNEATNDVNLVHDVADDWVLSCELKLVFLERGVQGYEICVKGVHVVIYNLVLELHASLIDHDVGVAVVDGIHDFNQHKCTLYNVSILMLLTRSREIADLLQNVPKVIHERLVKRFLVLIQVNKLLERANQVEFGFEL